MGTLTVTTTQLDEQINGVYAEIYAHDGAAAQNIPTGAGYTKVTAFTTDGDSQYCTADSANDKITPTIIGEYKSELSISFTAVGNNVNWFGAVFVDGVEQDKIHFERKVGVAGDYGSTQFGGLVNVASPPVDIDVRLRHDDTVDRAVTIKYANMNVHRIGVK